MTRAFPRPVQLALDHEKRVFWTVLLFPLFAIALILIFKLVPRLYMFVIREDSVVEWATAIVYLAASVFAASLASHFWRAREVVYALLYGILTLGMFFVAMEEISWGQRQLGITTPDVMKNINEKSELNIHNISGLPLHEAFIVVGFYGAFARLIAMSLWIRRYTKFVELLTPSYILSLYFFIPFAYYSYTEYIYYTAVLPHGLQWSEYWTDEHFIIGKDQEPLELLLSFGFLLFILLNWMRYRVGAPLGLGRPAGSGSGSGSWSLRIQ